MSEWVTNGRTSGHSPFPSGEECDKASQNFRDQLLPARHGLNALSRTLLSRTAAKISLDFLKLSQRNNTCLPCRQKFDQITTKSLI